MAGDIVCSVALYVYSTSGYISQPTFVNGRIDSHTYYDLSLSYELYSGIIILMGINVINSVCNQKK